MTSLVDIVTLAIPLMVLFLLVGLGLTLAVLVQEGQGRVVTASQIVGLINLALILPLGLLAWLADTRDVRWMFMFTAGAFALVGLMGVRLPRRFRD